MKSNQQRIEAFSKCIKLTFDNRIIYEYIRVFKFNCIGSSDDGLANKEIWADLCETLGLDKSSQDRFRKGVNKYGKVPMSCLDGQLEPYEPGFKEIFRYMAATDRMIDFPRGRIIINRAAANVLTRIHRKEDGYLGVELTEVNVERIRFVRRMVGQYRRPISLQFTEYLPNYHNSDLMGPIDKNSRDEFIDSLRSLVAEWNTTYDLLEQAVNHPAWLK